MPLSRLQLFAGHPLAVHTGLPSPMHGVIESLALEAALTRMRDLGQLLDDADTPLPVLDGGEAHPDLPRWVVAVEPVLQDSWRCYQKRVDDPRSFQEVATPLLVHRQDELLTRWARLCRQIPAICAELDRVGLPHEYCHFRKMKELLRDMNFEMGSWMQRSLGVPRQVVPEAEQEHTLERFVSWKVRALMQELNQACADNDWPVQPERALGDLAYFWFPHQEWNWYVENPGGLMR